jgi:hypothetical protein
MLYIKRINEGKKNWMIIYFKWFFILFDFLFFFLALIIIFKEIFKYTKKLITENINISIIIINEKTLTILTIRNALGIKPIKGGIPPKEKKIKKLKAFTLKFSLKLKKKIFFLEISFEIFLKIIV